VRQSRRTTRRARDLRRALTDAEATRWRRLRTGQLGGTKFRRQVPIGGFIADFCARNPKLVVEIDGGQHAEAALPDAVRTRVLAAYGYTVLRFWNDDVSTNIDGVLTTIAQEVTARKPAPSPSPLPR
jgi:very-short-patch-repair endonuclease